MTDPSPKAPVPRPGIDSLTIYMPGKAGHSTMPGGAPVYKLSSNESALGASPKAIEAFTRAGKALQRYPDGSCVDLRAKIAETHKIDGEQIICGAGSDELLQLLCRGYLADGDNIVQSAHGFLVYALAARACGAGVRYAPESDLTASVDALLARVDARTRIVFLANPNNPTGTYLPDTELKRLHSGLRSDIVLVIDSAYAEYMDMADYAAGVDLVERSRNTVMTRTFSKIYGLGALRLGWAYGPPAIIDVLNRIRSPFNVNNGAQMAGAAALDDQDFVRRNRAHNKRERDIIGHALDRLGLWYQPSFGNFLLVRFPQKPGRSAADIQQFLQDNGVLVREMTGYGLPDYLRISIGENEANQRVLSLLAEKFKAVPA